MSTRFPLGCTTIALLAALSLSACLGGSDDPVPLAEPASNE